MLIHLYIHTQHCQTNTEQQNSEIGMNERTNGWANWVTPSVIEQLIIAENQTLFEVDNYLDKKHKKIKYLYFLCIFKVIPY